MLRVNAIAGEKKSHVRIARNKYKNVVNLRLKYKSHLIRTNVVSKILRRCF